uniref:39S ribosomal protein L22, mitochondrial isoform X2 n=1 Tax=Jaculus jaculus TaxID=51337 RepID=UPI001E1B2C69|nr:39S ribosomal protein L22, mitochondrial isoform X2 [Jaculus jaculus]
MAAAALQKLGALWGRQLRSGGALASRLFSSPGVLSPSCIHTSASFDTSRKWEKKNKIVYPPQLPGEPRRPAEIYHCRRQIKYSKDKMWYLARLIRGMSIDQALAQLEFSDKKGAQIIKEVLLEAQDMAVRDHNVEFRSNLYVAESTSGRGQYLKRIRYHGRGRFGIMEKRGWCEVKSAVSSSCPEDGVPKHSSQPLALILFLPLLQFLPYLFLNY